MQSTTDINAQWKFFSDEYLKIVKECVPVKKRRPIHNIKPKWWTDQISETLRAKRKAHNKFRTTNNSVDRTSFIEIRRKLKRLIKQSKRSIEMHVANQSKSNPKEFYSYIRQKRVNTSTIGPILKENGDFTSNEEETTTILNSFFASVFTTEDLSDIPQIPAAQLNNDKILSCISVTEGDVSKCIDKIKVNKSPGADTISPHILKEAKGELIKPLCSLFNKSLQDGSMPDEWKLANVTPIFKKGSKSSPSNYRPISLTSVVCKILETLIRDKLANHLEENKLIKNTQHGFRNKRSCLTNLLDFFQDVLNQ